MKQLILGFAVLNLLTVGYHCAALDAQSSESVQADTKSKAACKNQVIQENETGCQVTSKSFLMVGANCQYWGPYENDLTSKWRFFATLLPFGPVELGAGTTSYVVKMPGTCEEGKAVACKAAEKLARTSGFARCQGMADHICQTEVYYKAVQTYRFLIGKKIRAASPKCTIDHFECDFSNHPPPDAPVLQ